MKFIPLVVGSLRAIPKQFGNILKQIGITAGTAQIQKAVQIFVAQKVNFLLKYEKSSKIHNV